VWLCTFAAQLMRAAAVATAAPPRRERLAGLVPVRAQIHAKVAAALPHGTMLSDFAANFLAAHEGMHALRRSLRSEHILVHDFLSRFYMEVRRAARQRLLPRAVPAACAAVLPPTCSLLMPGPWAATRLAELLRLPDREETQPLLWLT